RAPRRRLRVSTGQAAEQVTRGDRESQRLQRMRGDVLRRGLEEFLGAARKRLALVVDPVRSRRGGIGDLIDRAMHADRGLVQDSHVLLRFELGAPSYGL